MLPCISRTWMTRIHWRHFALTSPPLGKRGTKTWYKEDPLHPFNLLCNSSLKLVSHDQDNANCLKSGVIHGRMYEAPSPCYSHFFVQGELSSDIVQWEIYRHSILILIVSKNVKHILKVSPFRATLCTLTYTCEGTNSI